MVPLYANREAKLGRRARHVGAAARPLVLPDIPLLLRCLPVALGVSSILLVVSYSLRHVGLAMGKKTRRRSGGLLGPLRDGVGT
ncbi:hypothetical protein E2C01_092027 [Portunus trituberculatus]|uniref:Uncharacterized protein n=1 Tax=Portunus trituberculatus TaxID=210409 RepID=A0A5B7JFH3_PORTR|nr:hypothetical protein [Portunus trituberculatus]